MMYETQTRLALSTIFNQVQEIGTPSRQPVKSINQFISKAINYHTNSPIFANVFETKKNIVKVDKLFFDFDHKDKRIVEKDVETTINNLVKRGIPRSKIIKGWTTRKGDHVYAKLIPMYIDINEKNEDGNKIIDEWRMKVRGFQYTVSKGCESVDPSTFGEFSRVGRVFGIQRADNKMIPIIVDMDMDLNEWLREYRSWGDRIEVGNEILKSWGYGTKRIDNLIIEDDYKGMNVYNSAEIPNTPEIVLNVLDPVYGDQYVDSVRDMLKGHASPQLIERGMKRDADNQTRVALARALLELYGSNNLVLVCNILAMIGWYNFDWGFTYKKLQDVLKWKI